MNLPHSYNFSRIRSALPGYKGKGVRILFSIMLAVWCMGFLFPVIIPAFDGKSFINYLAAYSYSLVCHQSESAKVFIGDSHLLVCARCSGIYLGGLATVIVLLFKSLKIRLGLKFFILLSTPLIFDALAVRIGLYSYSKTFALFTGFLFGTIVIVYIIEVIEKSFQFWKYNYDS